MVIFDILDYLVAQIAGYVSQFRLIKNRAKVLQQLEYFSESCGLLQFKHAVLCSKKCFKKRGALYKIKAR